MSGELQAAIARAQAAQARSQGYRDAATRYDPSDLLTPDDSEIEVVPDAAREVWTEPQRSGYTRGDYERDKRAREKRGS